MKKFILILSLLFIYNSAFAQTPIQPMIDACTPSPIPCEIHLIDGVYDDPNPVYIRKDLEIYGSRNAIVHSEFQIIGGVVVRFNGFTLQMNKTGAPARTGLLNGTFPQNGMVVIMGGSTLWADDLEVNNISGLTSYALQKNAFYVLNGNLQLRAVTQFSRVDWRNSPYQVIELLYNSYANIFGFNPQLNIIVNLAAGTKPTSGKAAIEVASSRLIMSGSNLYNCANPSSGGTCGPNQGDPNVWGVFISRDSYVQLGAGLNASIQYFTTPQGINNGLFVDQSSRQWCVPGQCTIN